MKTIGKLGFEVLDSLDGRSLTWSGVLEHTGRNRRTVHEVLLRFVRAGLLRRCGRPHVYQLTDEGKARLYRERCRGRVAGASAREATGSKNWPPPRSRPPKIDDPDLEFDTQPCHRLGFAQLDVLDSLDGQRMLIQQLQEDTGRAYSQVHAALVRLLRGGLVQRTEREFWRSGSSGHGYYLTPKGRERLQLERQRGRAPGISARAAIGKRDWPAKESA